MPERIYIETTIPSFYYNTRQSEEMRVMSEWTRRWWDQARTNYELYTSDIVLYELERGEHPFKSEKLELMKPLALLRITPSVVELADEYVAALAMPVRPRADAMHLALASVHQCDILLTWNCEHLANPNKISQLNSITRRSGISLPKLLTPEMLSRKT